MGTTLWIGVEAPSRPAAIQAIEAAFQAVRRADSLLSTWRKDSEIAGINRAAPGIPVSLSPELSAALLEAAGWSQATGGAFDPAVGALVDAWGLRGSGRVPSPGILSTARSATGMHRFVFSRAGRSLTRTHPSAWIDTGAFGKGLGLRNARTALRRAGIVTARLNFGGQVLVLGADPRGADWIVPVAHPIHRNQPVRRLRARDASISTSSQSERSVTAAGRRIGHILDPRTGEPVNDWGSVTVVAEDPVVADVVSTALLVLGPDHGLRWAQAHQEMGVLFLVERQGRLEHRWNRALEQFLLPDSTNKRRS